MNAYIAKRKDEPGAFAMCFDHPNYGDETQRFIRAESKRKGVIVERTTVDEALRLLNERLHWSKP